MKPLYSRTSILRRALSSAVPQMRATTEVGVHTEIVGPSLGLIKATTMGETKEGAPYNSILNSYLCRGFNQSEGPHYSGDALIWGIDCSHFVTI